MIPITLLACSELRQTRPTNLINLHVVFLVGLLAFVDPLAVDVEGLCEGVRLGGVGLLARPAGGHGDPELEVDAAHSTPSEGWQKGQVKVVSSFFGFFLGAGFWLPRFPISSRGRSLRRWVVGCVVCGCYGATTSEGDGSE